MIGAEAQVVVGSMGVEEKRLVEEGGRKAEDGRVLNRGVAVDGSAFGDERPLRKSGGLLECC